MTFTIIFQAIVAALQFPKEILALVKMLKDSPEEQRQKIVAAAQVEWDNYQATGRPQWD